MTAKIKTLTRQGGHFKHKPRGVSDREFARVYWPYIPLVLLAATLLSFGAQTGAISAAIQKHGSKVLAYATSMSASGLLKDTNAARADNGVGGLKLNSKLNAAAQAQANDMANRNYWSHNTPEGDPPWVWVTNEGYAYQKLGQNLAAGFDSEQATINGWLASPPHRENLLDSSFTDVGFGYANNADYTSAGGGPMTIVVAFYGKPAAATTPVHHSSTPAASTTPTDSPSTPAHHTVPSTSSKAKAGSSAAQKSDHASSSSPSTVPTPNTVAAKPQASQPTTTDSAKGGVTLSYRTSNAQLAFAHLPEASYATGFAAFAGLAAMGLWITRHLLGVRRVFAYGETFVIKHPLLDICLLTIGAAAFLLHQTAGFIM